MRINVSNMVLSVMLSSLITGSALADDNAFGSLVTPIQETTSAFNSPAAESVDKNLHPLLQNSVSSNTLMAIMISPAIKIGLIRVQSGDEYFVRVGDLLGNAEGKITQITSDGIDITESDKVISLIVRNRSIANENAE